MNRNDYLKVQAAGKASRRKPKPTRVRRESKLAALMRDRPEMFSGNYFYAPVRAWKQLQHVPQCAKDLDIGHSQRMTQTRERILLTGDAQQKWAAIGNIGELRKVRK